jgi:signal peptidase I
MDAETSTTQWLRRGVFGLAGILLFIVGSSVVFWEFRQTVAPYLTASSAMEPTLHCARPRPGCEGDRMDRMFFLRFHPFWTPGRGDIVVFRPTESARLECGIAGAFVKRIIGLPREEVSIGLDRGAAFVDIDGTRLDEPYIEHGERDIGAEETFRVPEGHYFVMGDNRSQSCDSRMFGSVPRDSFVGPVVTRFWPLDRIGSP